MFHTCLAHGHDVGVALHQNGPVLAHNGVAGHVDSIQRTGLVIQRALRAVDVFRDLLVRLKRPSTKADEPACDVPDRKDDAPSVKIVEGSIFARLAQTTGHKPLVLVASLSRCHGQCPLFGPGSLRTIAQSKAVDGLVGEAPAAEISQAHALALAGLQQLLRIPLLGPSRQIGQAFPLGLLLEFFGGQLTLLDLNSVLPRQPTQSLRIRQLLVFHQERDRTAALA